LNKDILDYSNDVGCTLLRCGLSYNIEKLWYVNVPELITIASLHMMKIHSDPEDRNRITASFMRLMSEIIWRLSLFSTHLCSLIHCMRFL